MAEHISSALALYRPELTSSERAVALEKLVDGVGLRSCTHTKAGNARMKGLSGGQKRRLSLALALAKKPLVIFMHGLTAHFEMYEPCLRLLIRLKAG